MLRVIAIAFAVLSPAFAISQVTVHVLTSSRLTGSCPVAFSAQRSGGPTKMVVDSGMHRPASQQVQLRFSNITARNITQMSVTMHGVTGRPYVMPVVSDRSGPGTRSTHAELKLAVVSKGYAETTLLVDGVTSIRRIDLDSVLYDDGSEWHAVAGEPCSVEPNGFMLVSSQ